jgi:hypothetical protein
MSVKDLFGWLGIQPGRAIRTGCHLTTLARGTRALVQTLLDTGANLVGKTITEEMAYRQAK